MSVLRAVVSIFPTGEEGPMWHEVFVRVLSCGSQNQTPVETIEIFAETNFFLVKI